MELDSRPLAPEPYDLLPKTPGFTLTSADIADGAPVAQEFVAAGGNTSPALDWSDFPPETRSFLVNCFDPDAPTPAGFWHWTVADIPADVTSLPRGAGSLAGDLPAPAFTTRNDDGTKGYSGCAPPAGDRQHRYVFAVHALDVASLADTARLGPDTPPTAVAFNALFHTIARATLTPVYRQA